MSGRVLKAESHLLRMLRVAQQAPHGIEFVFVFDGEHWGTFPTVQKAVYENPRILVDVMEDECGLPAVLFNRGAELTSAAHLTFCSSAATWDEIVMGRLLSHALGSQSLSPAYVGSARGMRRGMFGHEPAPQFLADWMHFDPVVPLSYFTVPNAVFRKLGGFDTSPLLQQRYDHDFLLRLTRAEACAYLGMHDEESNGEPRPSLLSPTAKSFPVADDIARRYISRGKSLPPNYSFTNGALCSDPTFINDLPRATAYFLQRHHSRFRRKPEMFVAGREPTGRAPLRITITGGAYEHHHNYLCFYNYLHYLQGSGFATYQALHDANVTREDLIGSDIVFLSRCRSDNIGEIIGFCNDAKIPVIYMIDDNWLTVGRDWPDLYGEMFRSGSPHYDNFVHGIENCDAVLTYNRLLVEDIEPHAQRVVTLPNSVDLERFELVERPVNSRFVVGYAGSPRFQDASFEALVGLGRRRSDIDIFIMGSTIDQLCGRFDGCRLIQVPHQPYERYVQTLRGHGANILVAPLDHARTSRSKCPNKYLEITAAGAVGIYSAIEPYTWCINDGVNGRLILDDENPVAWTQAIEALLNKNVLSKMHAAARADVHDSYRSSSVALLFEQLVLDLVEAGSRGRRSRFSPIISPAELITT